MSKNLRLDFALHPITQDEATTCSAMLAEAGRLTVLPHHNISNQGEMMGYRYEVDANHRAHVLPITRTTFFGHTATECGNSEAIMRLLSDPEANRARMREFIEEIRDDYQPAELACIPDNATAVTSTGIMQATDLRSVDCRAWRPELPEIIGLYHAYIRGYNRDARTHKLFIVCSGGCNKASDEFCNLMIDVGREWTCGEVAESEEAWWLKKACQRARCRLIKRLADKFELRVPYIEDVLAYDRNVLLAVPTVDTVEHDISKHRGTVMIHNLSVDTTKLTNGILCQMHPEEGFWIFKGANRGTGVYGAMFGGHGVCGSFPTRSPAVERHPNAIQVKEGDNILREGVAPKRFVCFDEAFFKNLEKMQWNRDNGHIELIPIIVSAT